MTTTFAFAHVPTTFPAGTVVGAYVARHEPFTGDPTAAPATSAVTTATVQADGSLTFTGLNAGTDYEAAANVGGWKYIRFRTDESVSEIDGTDLTIATGAGAGRIAVSDADGVVGWSAGATIGTSSVAVAKTGKTAVTIADSGAQSSGVTIGGDTNLYRSAADTLKTDDSLIVGANVGFYGHAAAAKPTVSGSAGSNAALASLLTALAGLGLITDSSS